MRTKLNRAVRRGVTFVQVGLVLGVVTLIAVGSYYALGTSTSVWLNAAATNAGDPSTLVSRFNH